MIGGSESLLTLDAFNILHTSLVIIPYNHTTLLIGPDVLATSWEYRSRDMESYSSKFLNTHVVFSDSFLPFFFSHL